jgi:ATP-dependent DNA helicase DinG
MQRFFGPQGLLARKIEHFEFRESQLDMAEAVKESLRDKTVLLVEAGTGTGKTWAYLIPALASGGKIIISTGTKTLQDQILDHDIPLLKKMFFPQLRAVCMKGRKNYLCLRRYKEFALQPTLYNRDEAKLYRRFQKWASRTTTGDRAEIEWLPDTYHTWNEVSSSSEQCLGQSCGDFSRCFLTRLRLEAAQAHLLVVNHHLFFADLALRKKGLGEIIPDRDGVVLDEAHQLEDIACRFFGLQFSNLSLHELAHDIQKEAMKKAGNSKQMLELQITAQHLDPMARVLHHQLSQHRGANGRFPLDLQKIGEDFLASCRQVILALEGLKTTLEPHRESDAVVESFHRRAAEMALSLSEAIHQKAPDLVYWYEVTPQAFFIQGTPIEVAPIFQEALFSKTPAVVLTSATLSVAKSFDYLRHALGVPSQARELLLESPFAYGKQALLYLPPRFPEPQDARFCERVAEESVEILSKTHGRALFLFTSYRNMHEAHRRIKDHLPYPILVQGQKPKRALLSEFKEKIDSVLLATSSFWQGIDVPGDALSCLLIDKLPFEVPDDPLSAARMDHLAKQGKSAFFNYQIPRAIIHLKQGVGRLIRSSHDRGIIVIFDSRLLTKAYGRLFLSSLPPFKVVHQLEAIDDFLAIEESDAAVHRSSAQTS